MARQKIVYDVEFNSSAGVQKLKQELQSLKSMTLNDLVKINTQEPEKRLTSLKNSIAAVEVALDKSYSVKLNSTNLETFNQSLAKSKVSLNQIAQDFTSAGVKGQITFRNLATQMLTNNTQLKKTNSLLNSMATTLGNTIKWSIASGAIRMVTGGIRDAWNYAVKLDTSLNDIRIVTGKSADEMEKFAKQANKAAKELGNTTTAYTKASLIYYQQGLSEDDVKARTDVTIKAANVTGQATAEVSEQLTAVWNGYKVAADEAERYVDKLAAVAASTAVDLEELSVGMSKVASSAHAMGVDIDQLTAQIATIGSVTRQDTSIVGTALKTIFARMGDLKIDGVDEFGVKLGDVTGKMQQMGIQVLDSSGDLRDMGSIIEEVASKWDTWTQAQQQAAAVALAGKRQYNNLIALFENWDMYEKALTTSEASEGTLQKQQNVYMDSLQAHLDQLKVSGEKVYDALFDSDSMKKLIDGFASAKDLFAGFVNSIGGGGQLLWNFGTIVSTIFQRQISGGIANAVINLSGFNSNVQQIKNEIQTTTQFANMQQPAVQKLVELKNEELKYARLLSAEEKSNLDKQIQEVTQAQNKVDLAEEELEILKQQEKAIKNRYSEKIQNRDEKTGQFKEGFHEKYDLNNASDRDAIIKQIEHDTTKGFEASMVEPDNLKNVALDPEHSVSDKINSVKDYLNADIGGFDEMYNKASQLEGYDQEALDKLKIQKEELAASVDKYEQALAKENRIQEKLNKATDGSIEKTQLQKQLENAQVETKKRLNNVTKQTVDMADRHVAVLEREQQELKEQANLLKNYPQTQEKVTQKQREANAELKNAENAYKSLISVTKVKAMVNNIMGITNGISQMAGAISSLHNLGSIFKNENMTDGEKFLAVVQNLTMSLPMLFMGLTTAGKGILGFAAKKTKAASDTVVANAAEAASDGAAAGVIKVAEDIKTKEINETAAAQVAATGVMTTKANTEVVTEGITTGAVVTGEKIKQSAFKKTMAFMMSNPWIAIATAILGIIIALVAAFTKQESAVEKATKALEEEKESLAALNEQYKRLNEELTNVSNKFDELDKKQQTINDLQVGTEEWTKAVRENNQAVMELLSTYSELAPYIHTDENGVMTISTEGSELLEEKLNEEVNRAYAATIGQQQRVKLAENNLIKEKIKENDTFDKIVSEEERKLQKEYNKAVNKRDSKTLASLKPFTTTTRISGSSQTSTTSIDKDKIFEYKIDEWIDAYENNDLKIEKLTEIYGEEADAIYEQIAAMSANTAAVKAMEAQFAAAFYNDSQDRQNAKSKDAFDAYAGSMITKNASNVAIKKEGAGNSDGEQRVEGEDLQNMAKALGTTADQLEFKDGKVKIKGQDDKEAIDVDTAIERTQAYVAATELDTEKITKIVNAGYEAADRVGAASLVNLTGDRDSIALDSKTTTLRDVDNLDQTRDAIVEAQMKEGGYKTKDEWAKAQNFIDYNDYLKSYEKTKEQAQSTVRELNKGNLNTAFNSDNFKNATLAQAKNIANSFESVFKSGGSDAANAFSSMLDEFSDPETQEKIAQVASGIDWTAINAKNQFKAALEEANIVIDESSEYWNEIINSMSSAANVAGTIVNKFATIRNSLAEIKKLTESLSTGDIISDEDYKKAIALNPNAKEFFIQTADGYEFIGKSGKELQNILGEGFKDLDEIKSDFSALETSATTFKNLEDADPNSKKFKLGADADNITLAKEIQSTAGYENVLAAQGINQDYFDRALATINAATTDADKSTEEYKTALKTIESAITAVDTSIAQLNSGAFSSDAAVETWISYNGDSWSKTKEKLDENQYHSDSDMYNKFEEKWKNTFLKELGFEGLTSALGADELEGHLKNIRALELDYFEEINKELEKLGVKIERAFGSNKLTLLNQQTDLRKNEQEIANTLNDNAQASYQAIEEDFIKNAKKNFGVEGSTLVDSEGNLDINKLKDLQLNYDEESEEYKNIENIIELWNQAEDAELKAAEAAWAVIDAQIESFKYQQEVTQQFYEFQKSWLEFGQEFRSYAEEGFSMFESKKAADLIDDAFESYELNYADANDFLSRASESSPFNELIKAINGQTSIYKGTDAEGNAIIDESALQADFVDAIDTAQDKLKDLQSNLQSMYDAWGTGQEELMALYDIEIEKLSNINDIIKTQVDLRKTVAKITKTDYSSKSSYSKIAENAESNFALAQTQLEKAQVEYNKVMALGDKASKEMIATVTANLVNAQNTVMTEGSAWVEAVTTMYSEAMSETINSFIEDATGMDLEGISEAWEFAAANDERYLDDINSAYAEESLMRKFETSIDETDSIVAQNKLKEKQLAIEQKLTKIREEQGKLSQYDLDRANAEYELTLKQIALEEAQQTANKMKLTRDASGNYSYQYVADQDAIAKAEEELAAAQNDLYNLDKERNKSLVEEYYSIWSEYQSKLAEAEAAGDTDRVARLNEYYQELLGGVQTELSLAEDNLTEIGRSLAGSDWTSSFTDFTTAIQNANLEEVFGDLNSLTTESAEALKSMAQDVEAVMSGSAMTTALNSLSDNVKDSADLVTEAANIMDATADVLSQLPGLAASVDSLSTQLKNYANIYKEWVEDNTDGNEAPEELEENTDALRALTQAAIGLADKWDGEENGKTTFNGVNWTLGSDNIWTQDAMDDDNT